MEKKNQVAKKCNSTEVANVKLAEQEEEDCNFNDKDIDEFSPIIKNIRILIPEGNIIKSGRKTIPLKTRRYAFKGSLLSATFALGNPASFVIKHWPIYLYQSILIKRSFL